MQLSASACDPSTTSIRHVKVGKLPDATQSHIMQTRTSQSREATRPHLGIMWVTFGHLRSSGHIMPDHAGNRGAVFLVLAPHDHPAYQADPCGDDVTVGAQIAEICAPHGPRRRAPSAAPNGSSARVLLNSPVTQRDVLDQHSLTPTAERFGMTIRWRSPGSLAKMPVDLAPRLPSGCPAPDPTRYVRKRKTTPSARDA
jgi:hypothetical protein